MLGERLKRLRLARGMSLDDLVAAIDGQVSKQALSKYERGKMYPKATTLNRIGTALGVKSTQLWGEPACHVECVAFRKRASLSKKEQEKIKSFVAEMLDQRVMLQDRIGELYSLELPIQDVPVNSLDDAECAAEDLRQKWDLGTDPISNLVDVLEDRLIHIIEVDANDKFDGISAVARDNEENTLAAAIGVRRGTPGDRHRLNVAHELGHLTLNPSEDVDEEKASFRFGAAFLAPAEQLHRDVGKKRSLIHLEELRQLKRRYRMSMQALLYRLKDLEVITYSHFKWWYMEFGKSGWRKHEPIEVSLEKPERYRQRVYRALTEGIIEEREAERLLNHTLAPSSPQSLIERRALLKLPTDSRRSLLREQAQQMADYYQDDPEWRELEGGDFVENEPT